MANTDSAAEAVRAGEFWLRRVAGSEPPEWHGEVAVYGVTYRLRASVEWRGDGLALVGAVLWSAAAPRALP